MSNPWRAHRRQPEEFLGGLLSNEDIDQIEELAADPIMDRLPAYRNSDDSNRLATILDELAQERKGGRVES